MAATCGALMTLSFKDDAGTPAYQLVAGLRSKSIAINSELVDVTSASSTGVWREALDACGVRSATISGSGIFADDAGIEALRDAVSENELRDSKIVIPSFFDITGSFKVTSFQLDGEYNGAIQFSITLESAGALTFTSN